MVAEFNKTFNSACWRLDCDRNYLFLSFKLKIACVDIFSLSSVHDDCFFWDSALFSAIKSHKRQNQLYISCIAKFCVVI